MVLAPDGASVPCCQSCVSTRSSGPSWSASRIGVVLHQIAAAAHGRAQLMG